MIYYHYYNNEMLALQQAWALHHFFLHLLLICLSLLLSYAFLSFSILQRCQQSELQDSDKYFDTMHITASTPSNFKTFTNVPVCIPFYAATRNPYNLPSY